MIFLPSAGIPSSSVDARYVSPEKSLRAIYCTDTATCSAREVMDAPALCDSILQFVGGGLPAEGDTSNVPLTDLAVDAAGERVSADETSGDTPAAGDADRTGSTVGSGAKQLRLQKQGLMRAFMGNKVSRVRMRWTCASVRLQ